MKTVTPYNEDRPKKEQVEEMFDSISGEYDRLNSILSFGIHTRWRKRMIALIAKEDPLKVLDIATGTADLALECARQTGAEITGVDLSEKMLEIGREKIKKTMFNGRIILQKGDAESLGFNDETFDAVMVSFGVRNFGDLEKGLQEMRRVLRTGKQVYILEFSRVENAFLGALFRFYFNGITPLIGRIFSRDPRAYSYLPESVASFPSGQEMLRILRNCGFRDVSATRFTGGTATLYTGRK